MTTTLQNLRYVCLQAIHQRYGCNDYSLYMDRQEDGSYAALFMNDDEMMYCLVPDCSAEQLEVYVRRGI